MEPDLLPTLVSYYQQAQCTKEIGHKFELRKHTRIQQKIKAQLDRSVAEQNDLRSQLEDLKVNLAKSEATAEVRQREIETLRARHSDTDKADKALAHTLKVQADSYKREISEIRDDLKMRSDELKDLREDAIERDNDLKEARELSRSRDKEMKDLRDQLRARESEVRKANHRFERLQNQVQALETEVSDSRDALELSKEALAEAEERLDVMQAQKQISIAPKATAKPTVQNGKVAAPKAAVRVPAPVLAVADVSDLEEEPEAESVSPVISKTKKSASAQREEPATDYTEPPSKPSKKPVPSMQTKKVIEKPNEVKKGPAKSSLANKENLNVEKKVAGKKRKTAGDFTASPPRSSPPPESPKRKQTKKATFSMTPFADHTRKNDLHLIPLSPPSSKLSLKDSSDRAPASEDNEAKPKKKRRLLGGTKTLMDDTPRKPLNNKNKPSKNFGKELSPLKRPISSAGLIIRD